MVNKIVKQLKYVCSKGDFNWEPCDKRKPAPMHYCYYCQAAAEIERLEQVVRDGK